MGKIESRVNSVFREKINARVGRFLAKTRASPNLLTLLGILASFIACLITIKYGLFIGAFAVLISSLFDTLDGAVAKARNQTTSLGAFLDDIADRFGEIFYFTAIFWLESNLTVFLAAITSILVSYFNASARARGFKPSSGTITGRPGRIILLFILMLLSPWLPISVTLWLVVLLNVYTLVKRGLEVKQSA
jgi:phosphatidylglycerophosphate synthase